MSLRPDLKLGGTLEPVGAGETGVDLNPWPGPQLDTARPLRFFREGSGHWYICKIFKWFPWQPRPLIWISGGPGTSPDAAASHRDSQRKGPASRPHTSPTAQASETLPHLIRALFVGPLSCQPTYTGELGSPAVPPLRKGVQSTVVPAGLTLPGGC